MNRKPTLQVRRSQYARLTNRNPRGEGQLHTIYFPIIFKQKRSRIA